MRVAIVHYWFVGMRGGERVVDALCRMFPDADIFTHVVDRKAISKEIAKHNIRTSFISRLPFARRFYQKYLPLMPLALESLDLAGYDLVISSESGPAKGIIAAPGAVHLCYCHSPMRYLWDQYHLYRSSAGRLSRLLMPWLTHYLRMWDVTAAARVDLFVANSGFVAQRIRKYYRRDSDIVFPPVAVHEFNPIPPDEIADYYLWAGQLVHYKRPDIAIEAFNRTQRRLIVIGEGEERRRLERLAGPTITFLGGVSFAELKHYLSHCKALVFPGPEDFGIVPVEAQAAGRPVIAYGAGGVLDTVIPDVTGILYDSCTADGLIEALDRFDRSGLSRSASARCVANAARFGEDMFRAGILRALRGSDLPGFPADMVNSEREVAAVGGG